jgi:hypothetical protein
LRAITARHRLVRREIGFGSVLRSDDDKNFLILAITKYAPKCFVIRSKSRGKNRSKNLTAH